MTEYIVDYTKRETVVFTDKKSLNEFLKDLKFNGSEYEVTIEE